MASLEINFKLESLKTQPIPDGAYVYFYAQIESATLGATLYESLSCLIQYKED